MLSIQTLARYARKALADDPEFYTHVGVGGALRATILPACDTIEAIVVGIRDDGYVELLAGAPSNIRITARISRISDVPAVGSSVLLRPVDAMD